MATTDKRTMTASRPHPRGRPARPGRPDEDTEIVLRPFAESDFETLISWVPTEDALVQWCAAFFAFPLDPAQLRRYLEGAGRPHAREILTAESRAGEAVGHVELNMIWPHLSCRLSRVLVAPERCGRGIGRRMVALAVAHAFRRHHVARIDLGVSDDSAPPSPATGARASSMSALGGTPSRLVGAQSTSAG